MPNTLDQKRDLIYDLLDGSESSAIPHWFRKKHGVAFEVTIASSQALLLINETLGVMSVVYAGLDLLALPSAAHARTELSKRIQNSSAAIALAGGSRHPLYFIVIVNLTTALESGIENTIIVALRFVPNYAQKLRDLGIDCGACVDDRDLSYEEAYAIYAKLEMWKKANIKKAPPEKRKPPFGWLLMLEAIGLPVDLSEADCAALREMIYVRNCIIHRAGRADSDAATELLSAVEPNKPIRITQEDMGRFSKAAITLASGIANAVIERDRAFSTQYQPSS